MRFQGYIEKIADGIDVSPMLDWLLPIPFEEWPQQHPGPFGQIRPAMVNDYSWHHFGLHGLAFVENLTPIFGCIKFNNLMISVVMPGHFIGSHKDEQGENWRFRIHIPLKTNRQACIMMDRPYHMKVGSAYKMNTERLHAIVNHGDTPRIHLMFDVVE